VDDKLPRQFSVDELYVRRFSEDCRKKIGALGSEYNREDLVFEDKGEDCKYCAGNDAAQ
jgi:hypothetical protein